MLICAMKMMKHFLMMKMYLVSKTHHQVKNNKMMYAKKTKLQKYKPIASQKKQKTTEQKLSRYRVNLNHS